MRIAGCQPGVTNVSVECEASDERNRSNPEPSSFDFDAAVIGLGYIGLPTAAMLSIYGGKVCGVDISDEVLDSIRSGVPQHDEPDLAPLLRECFNKKRLVVSRQIPVAKFYVIAVPTPLTPDKLPDMGHVEAVVRAICPELRPGACVIIESTSPVGATERVAEIIALSRPDLRVPAFGLSRPTAMSPRPQPEATSTRERIKREARLLFATRGINGVSTREIIKASGQKNTASLGYYFGSKENLVRELIIDGAQIIDERRNAALDRLEADGGPKSVRQLTDILIFTAVRMSPAQPSQEDSYSRFITHIGQHYPALFWDTLGDRWLLGFKRCFEHFRAFMPGLPEAVKTQRNQLVASYLGAVLSLRERTLTGDDQAAGLWAQEGSLHHFSQTMAAMIEQPYEGEHFDLDAIDAPSEREAWPTASVGSVVPV